MVSVCAPVAASASYLAHVQTAWNADFPDARVVADPRRAFDDDAVDLVVVAAPNAVHASLAITALRAGRHVVVDKPFTLQGLLQAVHEEIGIPESAATAAQVPATSEKKA